jgi:hypothetical protein
MALQGPRGPVFVSRWDRNTRRRIEALRDKLMVRLGTSEPIIPDHVVSAMTWRKPLTLAEVSRMAPTTEVRARPGRP